MADDEVAQMVTPKDVERGIEGLKDAAALLERLQRELAEMDAGFTKLACTALDLEEARWLRMRKCVEVANSALALRARLEAAEALILDPVTLFHSPACIDRRFPGQCDCGVHALQERRGEYFAQRPAAGEP